jgi:hypothetical protein
MGFTGFSLLCLISCSASILSTAEPLPDTSKGEVVDLSPIINHVKMLNSYNDVHVKYTIVNTGFEDSVEAEWTSLQVSEFKVSGSNFRLDCKPASPITIKDIPLKVKGVKYITDLMLANYSMASTNGTLSLLNRQDGGMVICALEGGAPVNITENLNRMTDGFRDLPPLFSPYGYLPPPSTFGYRVRGCGYGCWEIKDKGFENKIIERLGKVIVSQQGSGDSIWYRYATASSADENWVKFIRIKEMNGLYLPVLFEWRDNKMGVYASTEIEYAYYPVKGFAIPVSISSSAPSMRSSCRIKLTYSSLEKLRPEEMIIDPSDAKVIRDQLTGMSVEP